MRTNTYVSKKWSKITEILKQKLSSNINEAEYTKINDFKINMELVITGFELRNIVGYIVVCYLQVRPIYSVR